MRHYTLNKNIRHELGANDAYLVNKHVDARSILDDVLVIACIARDQYGVTSVINAIPDGGLNGLPMVDRECGHLHAVFLVDDAILLELLHGDRNSLSRQLLVFQSD